MRSLFWFELKKMLGRRLAVAVNVGVVALIVGVMALNVAQCKTTDAQGEIISGVDAIAQMRADAEEHAGAITAERAAADIAAYQETLFGRIDRDAVGGMTGAAVYDLMFQSLPTRRSTSSTTRIGPRCSGHGRLRARSPRRPPPA